MTQVPHPPTGHGSDSAPWAAQAQQWRRFDSPLIPLPEDLVRLRTAWLHSLPHGLPQRRVDILILGVTPQYALHPWAPDQFITAVDSSETMLKAVWPGDAPNRTGVLGDWLHLPFEPAQFDLVLCDNGPTLFTDISQLSALGREMRRVLRPMGRVVIRNFVRPARLESVEAVVQAAHSGQIQNFHILKLRLLMALQGPRPDVGVGLGDTWEHFQTLFPDRAALAAQLGCPLETVSTIDAYRQRDARYAFHSLDETAAAFADSFSLQPGPAGSYPFAECCAVFSLTPNP